MSSEGDQNLSGWDSQLWRIVYHILLKFGVPVLFKEFPGDAREASYRDTFLQWFIPEGPHYEAVEHFILNELEKDIKKGKFLKFDEQRVWAIGLSVKIYPFSGIKPYLERKYLEPLVENLAKNFFENFKNE